MTASVAMQLIVDGLAMGLVYVLLASGFNLIMTVPKVLFIAYGEFYMLGAYVLWGLVLLGNIPFLPALCLATIATAILGGIVYRLIFQRIQYMEQQFLTNIIAALALSMIIAQGALLVFGTESRGMPSIFPGIVNIGAITIAAEKIVLVVLTLAVLMGLNIFLQKTNYGRAMRAVSFNADVAALQGVSANMTCLVTMAVGCGLAGFAGGLMAPVFALSPKMGSITIFVLFVVMLGGIGSMVGAILAGLILGMTLSFGQFFFGSGLSQIVFFVVIFIILYFRPGGLLGKAEADIPI